MDSSFQDSFLKVFQDLLKPKCNNN